jgi:hypothetical protein
MPTIEFFGYSYEESLTFIEQIKLHIETVSIGFYPKATQHEQGRRLLC